MANLTFTTGSEAATVKLKTVGSPLPNSFNQNINEAITIPANSSITFVGSNNYLSRDGSNYYQFETSGGDLTVSGDLVSLVNNSQVKMYGFINLFKGCTNIKDISNLVFPASIADWCYSNMFAHCTGLVNAGTILPATSLSRWCYNGMFAGCTSLTTPPTIAATTIALFGFYSMFYGCSSLKDAPAILAKTMNGEFTCNGMFRNCSSLSSVTVSINSWSTSQNENKNWLYGVAGTGTFNYPNTLASIPAGVKPEGWTAVATYPSIIDVESQTFSFDAMSDTSQTKEFSYSYNGEETVSIQVDTTNKPSWLTYTTDSNSVDFVANGYSIDSSTSFEIPITFSASDAATKSVVVTFNISNYPTATITVSTIPTFTFDADSETDIVSSLLTYATGSNSISCQIEGELPTGLSCVDGIITGVPADFTENYSGSFDIVYSASDARNVSSSFDLEIINAAIDYSTMPITFEALNGASTIKLAQTGSPNSVNLSYKKKDGSWTPYTVGTTINLTDVGDTVSFSGSNTGFSKGFQNNYYNFQSTGNYQMVYGNLMSLVNWQTQIGANMFDVLFKQNTYLVDASNLILPNNTATQCYVWFIANCSNLSAAPYFRSPSFSQGCYWAMCEYSNLRKFRMDATGTPPAGSTLQYTLQSNTNLSALEVHFDSWNDNRFLANIPNSAGRILIKSPSTPKTSLLSNWTTLNRDSNGVLWNTDSSGNSTTQYTGEDPFADYK